MTTLDPQKTPTAGGVTSASTPTTAAAKPAAYQYAGQGWNDPLAQQMYSKYMGFSPGFVQKRAAGAGGPGSHPGVNYQDPIDPKNWGGSLRGPSVDKMKAAYLAAGGLGTYDQLAATNPKSVGYPSDTAGNPLPRAGATGPEYLQPGGQWSSTLNSMGQPAGGSGSSFSLGADILNKMWRR